MFNVFEMRKNLCANSPRSSIRPEWCSLGSVDVIRGGLEMTSASRTYATYYPIQRCIGQLHVRDGNKTGGRAGPRTCDRLITVRHSQTDGSHYCLNGNHRSFDLTRTERSARSLYQHASSLALQRFGGNRNQARLCPAPGRHAYL